MGIGLALVKRLTELQGGTVAVASEGDGKGAVFTVRFPAVSPPAAVPALAIRSAPVARRRVLLIDDNVDMRETLAACLSMQGHDVTEAGDGPSALQLASEFAPDVIVVDIGLPEMDGYEVARRLRADPLTRDVRLVALTGYGQQEDKQKALNAGFDEHLTKPVDSATLEQVIAGAATRRQATPAA
jgi:CheY-like chemotaxis protein